MKSLAFLALIGQIPATKVGLRFIPGDIPDDDLDNADKQDQFNKENKKFA